MKNKCIWIINQYSGSIHHKKEYRSPSLAKEFVKLGYNVTILSSTHSHHFKSFPKVEKTYTLEKIDSVAYLWIKTKPYAESKSVKRVLSMFEFIIKLFFIPMNKLNKPDFIYVSSPSLLPILNGIYLKKKFGAKLIFEVRDLWPLSIMELGNISSKNLFIVFLQFVEKLAYKKSDVVISLLSNAKEYMISKGMSEEKFNYIPNGIDRGLLKKANEDSSKFFSKIPNDKFIIGYAGSFGIANDLYTYIDVAERLVNYNDICFVLIGDGPEKNRLRKYVENKNINNVLLLDSVARNEVHSVLKKFDLCYLGLQNQPLFYYGVSPTKLFDYMAASKPVVYVIDSGNHPVLTAKCGYEAKPGNSENISETILKLYELNKSKRDDMGRKGYDYLIENHIFDKLAKKIIDIIDH